MSAPLSKKWEHLASDQPEPQSQLYSFRSLSPPLSPADVSNRCSPPDEEQSKAHRVCSFIHSTSICYSSHSPATALPRARPRSPAPRIVLQRFGQQPSRQRYHLSRIHCMLHLLPLLLLLLPSPPQERATVADVRAILVHRSIRNRA